MSQDARVLRPANYPREAPGFGSTVVQSKSGVDVGVINIQGRVFMQAIEDPFRVVKSEIDRINKEITDARRRPTGPHKKKRELLVCPHCKKASDASNAKRWHFDNCKSKINY